MIERMLFVRNRRAQIPIVILVLGVVAVCVMAIFSFITSSSRFDASFSGISVAKSLTSQIESYHFYISVGEDPSKYLNIEPPGRGEGKSLFSQGKGISIRYYLP